MTDASSSRFSMVRIGWAKRLAGIAEIGLGMILAATPVALWIAWSATLVFCIMLVAVVSAALLALLADLLCEEAQAEDGREAAYNEFSLPDEFIEEVHRLFPLIYHHSRFETASFRQTMDRLSRLLGERGPGDGPR